jgi:glyoxylase-like metal-dependent hydrolase (beta-lactamase superfamily II)
LSRYVAFDLSHHQLGRVVVSILFSWYAENFGSYNKTYGSPGCPHSIHVLDLTVDYNDLDRRRAQRRNRTSATTGRLPAALAALGVPPEAVSAVFITHMHADHIGGLVADGRPAFPSAEVFVNRADVAHFTNPARKRDEVPRRDLNRFWLCWPAYLQQSARVI